VQWGEGKLIIKSIQEMILLLASFPNLYPDELLYSGIARYHQRSGNQGFKQTVEDLYGHRLVSSTIDLPSYLRELADRLSIDYAVDKLINKHTLLPYYAPFLSEECYKKAVTLMEIGSPWGMVHVQLGLPACRVKNPDYLRFCSKCNQEDRAKFGEPYWHRVHQLPGVLLCPNHHIMLTCSKVWFSTKDHKHEFIPLSELEDLSQKPTPFVLQEWDHLLYIAEQSKQLLDNSLLPIGLEVLRQKYIQKLRSLGFVSNSGKKKMNSIVTEFKGFYGDEFLRFSFSDIRADSKETWIHKLFRKPKNSCHPLRHLLVLRFLKENIDLITKNRAYLPFGAGPWPCLNKASDHYGETVINECKIHSCTKTRQPIGVFTCSCGFVYSRRGTDLTIDDQYRRGRVKLFGHVWMNRLKELSQAGSSMRSMAAILGVDAGTVKNQLAKLNGDSKKCVKQLTQELRVRRNRMLKTITLYKDKGRKTIQLMNAKDYVWLYRNDREWLFQHLPDRNHTKSTGRRADWEARDQEISQLTIMAIQKIKQFNPPIRISISEVGRHINQRVFLEKHLDKLPRTKELLMKSKETTDEFQVRRLEWAATKIKNEEMNLKGWRLFKVAGISRDISECVFQKVRDLLFEHDNLFVTKLKSKIDH
jgi:hypothetical protein